jgi:predicted metal-dependent phosphoesterase TrpH
MGKADLHIHTDAGDGLDSIEAILEHVEHETDLDVIAITEHDSIEVALRAREIWARRRYRFEFVAGVEVTTLEGHVIALYVDRPVPSLRPVEETLAAVHGAGGVCFVPHPLSWLTRSIGPATFARLHRSSDPLHRFDAVELAQASPARRFYIEKARRLNEERYRLPIVGASDAHFRAAIGSAYTRFEGRSAADLRAAFASGRLAGEENRYPRLRELGLSRCVRLSLRGLGATPRRLGWRRTAWSFLGRYARPARRA